MIYVVMIVALGLETVPVSHCCCCCCCLGWLPLVVCLLYIETALHCASAYMKLVCVAFEHLLLEHLLMEHGSSNERNLPNAFTNE